jgi:hypothetical protein
MPHELQFIIRYTGGSADDNRLDLYDASVSIAGFAKALSITTYALLNKGKVKRHGDATKGVDFLLHPSRRGSFIELVSIVFDNGAVQIVGTTIITAVFWDFINYTWEQATGRDSQIHEPRTRAILNNNPSYIEEVTSSLEAPLRDIHRPIASDNNIVIEIRRPRTGVVLEFNRETLDFVMSEEDPEVVENILGNVTKYNNISGIGRFYDNDLARTVSIHSKRLTDEQKKVLTWSLHDSNGDFAAGKIKIDVKRRLSRSGSVKQYIVVDAKR